MWRWLIDRVRRRKSHSALPDEGKNTQTSAVTVLYAKVNLDANLSASLDHLSTVASQPPNQPNPASGDIAHRIASDTLTLKHRDPVLAARSKRRRRQRLRFARRFGDMTGTEARLLFAIHRRSVEVLAKESPAALQRDLQRFILSSRGQRISRGQPVPGISKVKCWVEEARQCTSVC